MVSIFSFSSTLHYIAQMKLKELEDFDWFPSILREMQLAYIGWLSIQLPIYKEFISFLKKYKRKGHFNFFDLCSGSGYTASHVLSQISTGERVYLSDKYPPKNFKSNDKIHFHIQSLDVLKINFEATYFYTMFNSFHHFSDVEKIEIIDKLKVKKCSFCFVEILAPNIKSALQVIFASTLLQWLLCPFVKPFSIQRLIFTLFLPINILTVLIDGLISVYKSKSKDQFESLISVINDDEYSCDVRAFKQFVGDIIIISGTPK